MLKPFAFVITALSITPCWADLPLDVEDLITEKNEAILEFNVGYFNSNTNLGLVNIFTSNLGYRYGVSANTEVYGSVSAEASDSQGLIKVSSPSSSMTFDKLRIGVNHRFSPDNDTPAFIGFAEVVAVENVNHRENECVYGKTVMVGFTAYRTIDPIVLSLTSSFLYTAERTVPEGRFNPGEAFSLSPGLGFAINHKVSVT